MENPVLGVGKRPKPARGAEQDGALGVRHVRSFGEPGAALKSGFAQTTRQVTLRSLTTFFESLRDGGYAELPPRPLLRFARWLVTER